MMDTIKTALTRLTALAAALVLVTGMALPALAQETSDETAKASYTVTDAEVIAAGDVVVATLGQKTLTNRELQVYYWMEVNSFLNQYGSYAAMFGLDYTQSLDAQECMMMETGGTWQQYFLASALNSWMNYQVMALEAEAEGFQMDESLALELEALPEMLEESAAMNGLDSADALLRQVVGAGAGMEEYLSYAKTFYTGMNYFEVLNEREAPTDEEVAAYFAENEEAYAANGLSREDKYVDVRHILIMPEGADSATIRTETFGEEAWAASKAIAEDLLAQFEASDRSEETFAQMAVEHSQDGSASQGGLYTEVAQGQMVENFENWCFDAQRQTGDYGLVETEFGYHLMFYVGGRELWPEQVKSELVAQLSNDLLAEMLEKYTMEADFTKMVLGYVNLAGEEVEAAPEQEDAQEDIVVTYGPGVSDVTVKEYANPVPVVIIAAVSVAGLAAAALVLKKKEEH